MKRTILFCMLLAAASTAMGQKPDWQWAVQGGGKTADMGKQAVTDPSGNLLITATFSDSATFGDIKVKGAGFVEAAVAKLSPQGTWLWAYPVGGIEFDAVADIASDASGNVYVLATVTGDSVLCGSADGTTATPLHGDADAVLVKYDPQGHLLWVRAIGSAGADAAAGLVIGPDGMIHVAGDFTGSVVLGGNTISSTGGTDVFVADFSSDGTPGKLLRGGGDDDDHVYDIGADDAGNIFIAGEFAASAGFGDRQLTGGKKIFVVKYAPAGTVSWAMAEGGDAYQGFFPRLAVAGNGDCYITGAFREEITLGTTTLVSEGELDTYLAKYNSNGQIQWTRQIGGTLIQSPSNIITDAAGRVYVTGGSQNISPGALFIKTYDAAGTLLWEQQDGGAPVLHSAMPGAVAVDESGNVYMVASFSGRITFASTVLTSNGSSATSLSGPDIVVAKLASAASVGKEDNAYGGTSLTAISRIGETISVAAMLERSGHAVMRLYDARGTLLRTLLDRNAEQGELHVAFNTQDLPPGLYLLNLRTTGGMATRRMMIVR